MNEVNIMVKTIKTLFVVLSLVLTAALCFACVQVARGPEQSVGDASSAGEEPSDESFADSSVEESSEESVEDSFAEASEGESSEEESSADEASEDESSAVESAGEQSLPPSGTGSQPITPPPAEVGTSEYDSYFNGSLFVGHSVMVHFKMYTGSWRSGSADILGDAMFCCTSAFSFFNNLNQKPEQEDNVLPKYQGVSYRIEDLPAVTGRKTMYLGLMGLNDLGMVGANDTCARLVADEVIETIGKIKEKTPDIEIVILASTYLSRARSYPNLNNANMSLLNNYMLEYCSQNGLDFIDVATPLTDEDGYLADVYCSDNYCHLQQGAYYVWMDVLRDYAKQKIDGTWQNPQSLPLFEG